MTASLRLTSTLALACFCLIPTGCDRAPRDSSKHEEPAPPAAKDQTKEPESAAQQTSSSASPIASRGEVEAFLNAWVSAQNSGKFADYERHYARQFLGVKRAKEQVTRFSRKGWLEDRKAMFTNPFVVQTNSVQQVEIPGSIAVTFEQSWKSKTYQDVGKKRLLLVREDKHLRIAREEMLSSAAEPASSPIKTSFESVALARQLRKGFALLVPGPVNIAWASGHPEYISDTEGERSVSTQALPARTLKYLEPSYDIFDRSGARCRLKAENFKIMTKVIPSDFQLQAWRDAEAEWENRPAKPIPHQERALQLWKMALLDGIQSPPGVPMGLTLGLSFASSAECPDPLWGRASNDAPVVTWVARVPTSDEFKQMQRAAPSHPAALKMNQLELVTQSDQKQWYESVWESSARVLENKRGETYFYATLEGLSGECGSFATTDVLWRKQGGTLAPVMEQKELNLESFPRGALDLNGDGQIELLTENAIYTWNKNTFIPLLDHSPPNLGCGC